MKKNKVTEKVEKTLQGITAREKKAAGERAKQKKKRELDKALSETRIHPGLSLEDVAKLIVYNLTKEEQSLLINVIREERE